MSVAENQKSIGRSLQLLHRYVQQGSWDCKETLSLGTMRGDNETLRDPRRPKENLLSPETTRPRETQRESLESRAYATVSELPPPGSETDSRWVSLGHVVSGLKRFSLGLLGSPWVSLGLVVPPHSPETKSLFTVSWPLLYIQYDQCTRDSSEAVDNSPKNEYFSF